MGIVGYLNGVLDGDEWGLANRSILRGRIKVSVPEMAQLAASHIGKELAKKFTEARWNGSVHEAAWKIAKSALDSSRPKMMHSDAIPPCMAECAAAMQRGDHLKYNGRFALASFHGKRGMSEDVIVDLYRGLPDFKEYVTRSQIRSITAKGLMPYSCSNMEMHGLCKRNASCGSIKNPLAYRSGVRTD